MALAGDAILVTPGSGATIATETVSAKAHEVWMGADPAGHIEGSRAVWVGTDRDREYGLRSAANNIAALWNGTGSGVTLEVIASEAHSEDDLGDTSNFEPAVRCYRLTSAPTAGTTRTPVAFNTTSSALPAQVLFYQYGVTATKSGDPLGFLTVNTRSGGPAFPKLFLALGGMLMDPPEPIVLAEGEGLVWEMLSNNNSSAKGGFSVHFRVR